ncbi:Aldehyde dehydrogenase 22A1 [Glycine soja]
MAFWWPLLVLAFAYGICRFLLMLIPPKVPSIDVDTSDVLDDGNQAQENSFIYVPPRGTSQQSGKIVQCYEPATMKYLGYVPALTNEEVKDRVSKVRKAQKMWAKSSFKQRRLFLRILLKISSRDTGKTMVDASLGEIMTTCEKINWLLSEGEQWLKPEYRSSGRSMLHKRAKVEFHPLGVIGAIVSWNYPFHNIFNPMLAAIFSGNGIVIKISEHASWSGCFYFRIIQSALAAIGAPEDLVEVITGFAETGEALVSSVDKVIFVGSPGVGKMIMNNASNTLIPVTLELGGKDAFIVCEDADLDHVAQIAVRAVLQSSGQNCAGAERFYVHREIYSSFVSKVTKIVKSVTAGPPLVGKYDMGALCMHEHSEKLEGLVNDALDKGAEIVARGNLGHIGEDAVDQYFPPTVIVNVNHTMRLMQEEAFGPIMPIMKFSSDEEVVRLANDSKYGLGCAVFSGNQSRAREIASQIHAGVAAVNDFASTYMCQSLPFGGVKHSGFGRFGGVEGLRACCLVKAVVEDRWWPFVKTKIPKPIQYPVAENGFEFQESLVEALYGLGIWDRLRALVNVLKMLTEQNPGGSSNKRRND